jgi:hypothetical protein
MFNMSLNLFSTESNKHTYSFEKQYYTRSIEFSDYLRTEFKRTDEPIVIYFLNESNKDSIRDTVSAALPIWLDKVPTAVAGVVYDAQKLENLLFKEPLRPNCNGDPLCSNICNRALNLTCYLIDEHGIVVLTNSEQNVAIIGQPLYKMNPWLMLQLEMDELYDLIVTGNKVQDCSRPPMTISGAPTIGNFLKFLLRTIGLLVYQLFTIGKELAVYASDFEMAAPPPPPQPTSLEAIMAKFEAEQLEWRIKNSHCFYFGIYSFNVYNWRAKEPSEIKTWCNGTRRYLAGYLTHSNLLMVSVEDEAELTRCGSIEVMAKRRPASWTSRLVKNKTATVGPDGKNVTRKDYSINRYRRKPEYCHNYFPNESAVFFCKSAAVSSQNLSLTRLLLKSASSQFVILLLAISSLF